MSSSDDNEGEYDCPYDDSLFEGQGAPAPRPVSNRKQLSAAANPPPKPAAGLSSSEYHSMTELADGTIVLGNGGTGRRKSTDGGAAAKTGTLPRQQYVNIAGSPPDPTAVAGSHGRTSSHGRYVNLAASGIPSAAGSAPSRNAYVNFKQGGVDTATTTSDADSLNLNALQMYSSVEPVKQDWYHGLLSREASQEVLISHGVGNGMFLVRKSENAANTYVVVVCHGQKIFHNRIEKAVDGNFLYKGLPVSPKHSAGLVASTLSGLIGNLMEMGSQLAQPLLKFISKDDGRL